MNLAEHIGEWINLFDLNELRIILSLLKQQHYTPKQSIMFDAFHYCPYNELNMVIIGQDPYPQEGIATGIAFANNTLFPTGIENENKLSPSLEVIETCLCDREEYCIFDPSLISWAKQGVLLLNTSLTTEVNNPGSHSNLWARFTTNFLKELSERNPAMIYILMGMTAQSYKRFLGPHSHIFECNHPSYYARMKQPMPNVFKEANECLYKLNGYKIDFVWQTKR